MKLTQIIVNGLLLPTGKTDAIYFDDDCPGLGLRLRAGGKRSWIYQYQIGSKQRRMTLGTVPALTLGAARKTASEFHARVRLGEDPATARDQRRRQAGDTVEAMLRLYLPEKKPSLSPRSIREVERHLLTYAKPLHGMAVASIARRDISTLSTALAASAGNATANNTRASLSTFFGWCITRGLIEENPVRDRPRPCTVGQGPHSDAARQRRLGLVEAIGHPTVGPPAGAHTPLRRFAHLPPSRSRRTAGGLVFAPRRTRRAIASREAIKISVRFLPLAISASRVPPTSRARTLSVP